MNIYSFNHICSLFTSCLRSFADWENEVSPLGELFYIESLPQTTVQTEFVNAGTKTDALAASENTSTKVQNHSKIKFTKGKFT